MVREGTTELVEEELGLEIGVEGSETRFLVLTRRDEAHEAGHEPGKTDDGEEEDDERLLGETRGSVGSSVGACSGCCCAFERAKAVCVDRATGSFATEHPVDDGATPADEGEEAENLTEVVS